MKLPEDLTREALVDIVTKLHLRFYVDDSEDNDEAFWDPDKIVNGGDMVDLLDALFGEHDLTPPKPMSMDFVAIGRWCLTNDGVDDLAFVADLREIELGDRAVYAVLMAFEKYRNYRPPAKLPSVKAVYKAPAKTKTVEHLLAEDDDDDGPNTVFKR